MAQTGIHKDPKVTEQWKGNAIKDDPVLHSNIRGTFTFATSGKDTRSNQIFFNLVDNSFLDNQGVHIYM